jgi:hypothetical protein
MPLAYFLTFSTYGTWLHGTAKGAGSVDEAHNTFGTPFLEPDPQRERAAQERMDQPPYVMSAAERDNVCQAIVSYRVGRTFRRGTAYYVAALGGVVTTVRRRTAYCVRGS